MAATENRIDISNPNAITYITEELGYNIGRYQDGRTGQVEV
jgi:hypothetical protein